MLITVICNCELEGNLLSGKEKKNKKEYNLGLCKVLVIA